MVSEYLDERDEDPCEGGAAAVLIESKREDSAECVWGPWIPHKAGCTRCVVVVRDAEERVRRHIA
jgi:hypothetical protein